MDFDAKNEITHCLFHSNPQGDYGLLDSVSGQISQVAGTSLDSTNLAGDPSFAAGPLGGFYLGQAGNSPAVDQGKDPAADYGLDQRTTQTDNALDSGVVDLGYHYPDSATVPQYTVTTRIEGGHGTGCAGKQHALRRHDCLRDRHARQGLPRRELDRDGRRRHASVKNMLVLWSDRAVTVSFDEPRTFR